MIAHLWNRHAGRELDTIEVGGRLAPYRLVACLNVWNDHEALRRNLPSWRDAVDHVIVVDGSYSTTGEQSLSTDGTREYLQSQFSSIEFLDGAGLTQCEKRTMYLRHGCDDDMLFVIDADEQLVTPIETLHRLPVFDIGWVRIQSPIYTKEYGQPRLFAWRPNLSYRGRHHWMYEEQRLFCTHQYGGVGFSHRPVDVTLVNNRNTGRSIERRNVKRVNIAQQNSIEFSLAAMPSSVMSDQATQARECLHILNYAYRDDGLAPSRLHSAINRTTPHSSTFFKVRPGPFGVPTQYDAGIDFKILAQAEREADVIHIHSPVASSFPSRYNVPIVYHHHGTRLRNNPKQWADAAERRNALVIVANLELLTWIDGVFLPNAVPVARYRALAEAHWTTLEHASSFRVAHSPTVRERKGTKEFLAACDRLRQRGYPIEPVLIEEVSHEQALLIKASCHAVFDSFWLGIQCSGIEGAAMGLPVIAGDEIVAQRYREQFSAVPYTFANSEAELEYTLHRLMDDPHFYQEEAARVSDYVTTYHDESAVALAYLDHLDRAFQWRSVRVRSPVARPCLCK